MLKRVLGSEKKGSYAGVSIHIAWDFFQGSPPQCLLKHQQVKARLLCPSVWDRSSCALERSNMAVDGQNLHGFMGLRLWRYATAAAAVVVVVVVVVMV